MLLRLQSLSLSISNASPHYRQKKRISCMVTLMSHFPRKGQDFAHFSLFRFFSLYVLPFTIVSFLFNWLVLFFLFFLPGLSLSEKKTQRGSPWHFSFFIFPYVAFRPHPSLSLFLSMLLLPSLRSTISSFRRCAVQSCSKSRVCSCWSSSIFLRLLDP